MKWLLISVTIFLILLTLLAAFILIFSNAYKNRFFPGVAVNNESLGQLSHGEALKLWQSRVDDFIKTGLKYKFDGKETIIFPTLSASDPDVSFELVSFNVLETIDGAYLIGRSDGVIKNFLEQTGALILGYNTSLSFKVNQTELLSILRENFKNFESPKLEARPAIAEDLSINILPETAGTAFDYQELLNQSINRLKNLSAEPIEVKLKVDEPVIKKEDVNEELINQLAELLKTPELTLTYDKQSWTVSNRDFKNWLIFEPASTGIKIGLDASGTMAYLEKNIAPKINRETLNAKFEINNGRVDEFQGSSDGRQLELDKSYQKITQDWLNDGLKEIELTVIQGKADIQTGDINDLGVKEIIGTGHSNFAGSPQNRRHNIAVGAASLNGILIKPGETFSLIGALGEINAETGYKPELVIKGDRTIPEYGGGLCQIGTTVFRSVLAGGLEVVERRNHSYRVVYYEPAGTDATIYNPYPDFKFKNDTSAHILIQSRIEGDDLYFDFWGTEDNRIVEQTEPVIYNIKSPGATIYIETDKLKPGEKNCIERAHNGADAYFDYKITYADGSVHEERFNSHYIPWPARCLVGVDPNKPAATTTPEIIE
jgi:vancomycin resistance protein YoaR